MAIEHGPANFSAKQPKITHKLRSHGVDAVSDLIISATSITESFDGRGESSEKIEKRDDE
jgi:spore cortex formation protein SpoVR/YcgB (stage V sporulation)